MFRKIMTADFKGPVQTLQQSLEFGTVHVDVLDELNVVDVHRVFRANGELL